MATIEEKKQALKDLIEYGKKKGKLSYKELMDVLEELEFESDQIDKLYDTFADSVLEMNDRPELVGDYIEDLKEMIHP